MPRVFFTFYEALDIDNDGFDEIYVQLSPKSGIKESTPKNSRVGKLRKDTFTFDTDNQLVFTLLEGIDSCTFHVKLYLNDGDIKNCYDGVGTIENMKDQDCNTKVECILYDNGNQDLPFGSLIYSWQVRDGDDIDTVSEGGDNVSEAMAQEEGEVSEAEVSAMVPGDDEGGEEADIDEYSEEEAEDGGLAASAPPPVAQQIYATTIHKEKSTKQRTNRPLWSKFDDYAQAVIASVRADMAPVKADSCSLVVKIHTAMYSPPSMVESDPIAAQVKLSVQPIPGKGTSLRTKERTPSEDGTVCFSFDMQTATLAMSSADLHSKAYVSGCAPVLHVEFTSGAFSAVGSLYLPALLRMPEGKLIALHLRPKLSDKMLGLTQQDDTAPSPDLNSTFDGNVSVILEVSRPAGLAASTALTRSMKTMPPASDMKVRRSTVSVNVKGIYGSGLKEVSRCFVETSLCASGVTEASGNCSRKFKKGVFVDYATMMRSDCSDLDVLLLQVYGSVDGGEVRELGQVQVPLSTVLSKQAVVSGCFQAVHIEPPSQKGVKRLTVLKWGIFCELSCQYEDCDDEEDEKVTMKASAKREQRVDASVDEMELMDAEENEDPVTSHIAKRHFETVKSVNGRLSVCVHGFVPKYGDTDVPSPSDVLSIEFSVPNSATLNEKTEGVKVCRLDEADVTSPLCALWEKEFIVPVVWALQQRFVGHLQGIVIRTAKAKPGENAKCKVVIGYISLDLASMVNMKDKPIVCALPVLQKLCSHEDYLDSLGYVMLGLHFDHARVPNADDTVPLSTTQKNVTLKKSVAWGDQAISTKKSTQPAAAMSPLPLPPSAFSALKKLCLERWPLFGRYLKNEHDRRILDAAPREDLVHVSMSLNSIEAVAGPLRGLPDAETIRVVVSSNEDEVSAEGSVDVDSGKISLRQGDVEVPLNLESNTSILVSVKIVRNSDDNVLGVAFIVLPRDLVITGRPMNIAIPLRDDDGLKTAVIICGCHFSSTGFHAVTAPISESSDATDSNYLLNVCVVEGTIRDGEWTSTLEPYFECSLVSPVAGQGQQQPIQGISMQVPPSVNCVGYTPTVDVHSPDDWNARCSLPIPTHALTESARPHSMWGLDVKCRDAARVKYPQIGHTQVCIPWSLLMKGKPLDLWVTLVQPSIGMSVLDGSVFGEDESDEDVDVESNTVPLTLRIRLDRVEKVTPSIAVDDTVNFPGVGQVAMWYHSIREGENRSEKCFGSDDIRAVDAAVQMSNPMTELVKFDEEQIPFRTASIDSRQSTHGMGPAADILAGKVTVPGGRSVIHMRLRTTHERYPLLTFLPTLSTLPRPSPACPNALSIDIPLVETVLRPDFDTTTNRQRLSRLQLGAVFVPYVSGYLYMFHSHLEVHDTAAERFLEAPIRRGALKYSLGGVGNCFTSSFEMEVTPDSVAPSSAGDLDNRSHCSSLSFKTNPPLPSGGRGNKFKRSKKAYKGLSPAGARKGTSSKKVSKLRKLVATQQGISSPKTSTATPPTDVVDTPYILVDTFEMLSDLGKSNDDTFDLRISLLDLDAVGKGYCLGVGHIQTAAIYYQALRNIFNVENKRRLISRCTMPTQIKLFDPGRRIHIATVSITLKFELTAISTNVINYLRAYKQYHSQPLSPTTGASVGRAELGLKQAFHLADKDNSGGVSSSELVATIRSITSPGNKGSIVGFDTGAIRLLLTLMEIVNGPPADEDSAYSEERIRQLFRAMDLDGDGQVSWWEWRQVLDGTATVLAVGEPEADDPPRYMDSLDPLVVSLAAAHAALMAENGGIVQPKPRLGLDDDDLNAMDTSPSMRDKRHRERMARLKSKNSRLQQKLDNILSSSQQAASPVPAHHSETHPPKYDEVNDEMRRMLEAEKHRRAELEAEVDRLNSASAEMVKSRSEGDLERANLAHRLAEEANRLREEMIVAYMSRKKYEKNSFVLKKFFLVAREKIMLKKVARERSRLIHVMGGLVTRKKYVALQRTRNEAAVTIQSLRRRVLGKRRVDLIRQSVRKIQEVVLLRKLRKAARSEYDDLMKKLVLLKFNASLKIREDMERKELENQAALVIQGSYRGHLARKVCDLYRLQRSLQQYEDGKKHQDMNEAALLIQSRCRGHLARKTYDLYRLQQCEDAKKHQDMNQAAVLIQSRCRGYFARKPRAVDDDVPLILRFVKKPPLESAVGHWISHPRHKDKQGNDDEQEALVMSVDIETMALHVKYLQDEPVVEAIVNYHDPKITHWFKMVSAKEEQTEVRATIKMQAVIRGK